MTTYSHSHAKRIWLECVMSVCLSLSHLVDHIVGFFFEYSYWFCGHCPRSSMNGSKKLNVLRWVIKLKFISFVCSLCIYYWLSEIQFWRLTIKYRNQKEMKFKCIKSYQHTHYTQWLLMMCCWFFNPLHNMICFVIVVRFYYIWKIS